MTVVVDGVGLALGDPGAAEVWGDLLSRLPSVLDMRIVLLDRGHDRSFDDVDAFPFPRYDPNFEAADSLLLEQVCRHFDASVFVSTGWTSPLATPSVLLVHSSERSRTQSITLAHARRFVCTSATGAELLARHPHLDERQVSVAGPGADLAEALSRALSLVAVDHAAGRFDEFGRRWSELRRIHAAVAVWE